MSEEHTNYDRRSVANVCSRLDAEYVNSQFIGLIRYWIRNQVQQSYVSSLDLEQIANDSMLDFITKIVQIEELPPPKLKGLCRVITKRRVLEEVRKVDCEKRIGPSHLVSLEEAMGVPDSHSRSFPIAQAETNDLKNILLKALSSRQQTIVKMVIEGHTQKEIAETLNVSTKTIHRKQTSIAKRVRTTQSEFTSDELIADRLIEKNRPKTKDQHDSHRYQRKKFQKNMSAGFKISLSSIAREDACAEPQVSFDVFFFDSMPSA